MLLSHYLTMRGCDIASLIEFRSGVSEEIVCTTDELTTDAWKDGQTEKNNFALAHPYHERE